MKGKEKLHDLFLFDVVIHAVKVILYYHILMGFITFWKFQLSILHLTYIAADLKITTCIKLDLRLILDPKLKLRNYYSI